MGLDISRLSTITIRPIINLLTGLKDLPLIGFFNVWTSYYRYIITDSWAVFTVSSQYISGIGLASSRRQAIIRSIYGVPIHVTHMYNTRSRSQTKLWENLIIISSGGCHVMSSSDFSARWFTSPCFHTGHSGTKAVQVGHQCTPFEDCGIHTEQNPCAFVPRLRWVIFCTFIRLVLTPGYDYIWGWHSLVLITYYTYISHSL